MPILLNYRLIKTHLSVHAHSHSVKKFSLEHRLWLPLIRLTHNYDGALTTTASNYWLPCVPFLIMDMIVLLSVRVDIL